MTTRAWTRISEEEFLALPETLDRVELIDGDVLVSPSPSWNHQRLVREFLLALTLWARTRHGLEAWTVGQAPMDIRFGPGRILQPDLFLIRGSVPGSHEGPLDQIPALCIEVVSADRVYDRITKRFLYAEAGVEEYWVVEPSGVVERWSGDGLGLAEIEDDVLESPLLPGFRLELAALAS